MISTFKIVPIPGFCFKGTHKSNTPRLIQNVRTPILKPVVSERPSAKTVQGLIPTLAVIINDSPNPNKVKPILRIKIVEILGEKFNDEKILFSSSLKDGIYSINITQPETAEIGDTLKYNFEVND